MNHHAGRDDEVTYHSDLRPSALGVGVSYHERLRLVIVIKVGPEYNLHHFINRLVRGTLATNAPSGLHWNNVHIQTWLSATKPLPESLGHGVEDIREWFC